MPDSLLTHKLSMTIMYAIAYSISGSRVVTLPGIAGKYKISVQLQLKEVKDGVYIFSVIRETGKHLSSYTINDQRLLYIAKKNLWIWKNRKL